MGLAALVLAGFTFGASADIPPADCRTLEACLAAVEPTALGSKNEPSATATIIGDQGDITPREQALVKALQRYGRKAAPRLFAFLESPQPSVRALAAFALRDLDGLTEAEVPTLLAGLQTGQDWLAPALGRIGSPAALEGLLANLRARPESAWETEYAFKEAGARAVPFLLGAFACRAGCDRDFLDALVSSFDELKAAGASATDGLIAIAVDDRRLLAVRRAALKSLGAIGEAAVSATPIVQKLGRAAPRDFADLMQPVLEDMKSPAALDALISKLRADPDSGTLAHIARLRAAGRGAGSTLVGLLGHWNWDVRLGAARAIGYVGYAEASPQLQAALRNEEDWRLVYAAAESLGRLKDPTATAPLSALANHWFPPVREAALKATSVISGHATYESRWHEKNFAFEFDELEHVGSDLACKDSPRSALGSNQDLARARAAGMTYDATVVGFGPGPGGKPQRHETPIKQKPNAALEIDEGWFLGGNRGEWGGELVFVDRSGRQRTVFDENVHALARLGERIVAMIGLAHIYENFGMVRELVKDARGHWTTRPWRALPGEPSEAGFTDDHRLWIRTNAGDVALSEDGHLSMVPCLAGEARPAARTPRP